MQAASTVQVLLAVKLFAICFLQTLLEGGAGRSRRRDAIGRPVLAAILEAQQYRMGGPESLNFFFN